MPLSIAETMEAAHVVGTWAGKLSQQDAMPVFLLGVSRDGVMHAHHVPSTIIPAHILRAIVVSALTQLLPTIPGYEPFPVVFTVPFGDLGLAGNTK